MRLRHQIQRQGSKCLCICQLQAVQDFKSTGIKQMPDASNQGHKLSLSGHQNAMTSRKQRAQWALWLGAALPASLSFQQLIHASPKSHRHEGFWHQIPAGPLHPHSTTENACSDASSLARGSFSVQNNNRPCLAAKQGGKGVATFSQTFQAHWAQQIRLSVARNVTKGMICPHLAVGHGFHDFCAWC